MPDTLPPTAFKNGLFIVSFLMLINVLINQITKKNNGLKVTKQSLVSK